MDQRSDRGRRGNKDVFVILAVIATIVVLAVVVTWTRGDQPEVPLDTDPNTSPVPTATP